MEFSLHQRRAGVLLHPSSLPSGTTADATRWLDLMQQAGLSVWQLLPLGVPQTGLSPYLSLSAFALNPLLFPPAPPVDAQDGAFGEFCEQQHYWLDDYARFALLRRCHDQQPWYLWPAELKHRDPEALAAIDHADQMGAVSLLLTVATAA